MSRTKSRAVKNTKGLPVVARRKRQSSRSSFQIVDGASSEEPMEEDQMSDLDKGSKKSKKSNINNDNNKNYNEIKINTDNNKDYSKNDSDDDDDGTLRVSKLEKQSNSEKQRKQPVRSNEDSSIINKEVLEGLKFGSIKKRIMTSTAQKQWEELSVGSQEEVVKLMQAHVEPALGFFRSEKQKHKGRALLQGFIRKVQNDLDGTLVPVGFKSQKFNLDFTIRQVSYLQKTYSENLKQVAELERTALKEERIYASNKEYLSKLEKNFKKEERAFHTVEKLVFRPLKKGPTSLNTIGHQYKFADDSTPHSYDNINFEALQNDVDGVEYYDPNEDEQLTPLLEQLNRGLTNIEKNVAILQDLNSMVESTCHKLS